MTEPEFSPEQRAEIAQLAAPRSSLSADAVLQARTKATTSSPRGPLALAAVALLAVGAWSVGSVEHPIEDGRAKGAVATGATHLQAAAEGPAGTRPLAPNAHVGPDERVLFSVHVNQQGWLHMQEGGRPMDTAIAVNIGTFTPGGSLPQSWRPDGQESQQQYSAWLCPDTRPPTVERCAVDRISLVWDRD